MLLGGCGDGEQKSGGEELVSHRGKDTAYPLPLRFLRKIFRREDLGLDLTCATGQNP
jgi:hypothetical protein